MKSNTIYVSDFGNLKLRPELEKRLNELLQKSRDKIGRRTKKTRVLEDLIDAYASARAEFEWRLGLIPKEF